MRCGRGLKPFDAAVCFRLRCSRRRFPRCAGRVESELGMMPMSSSLTLLRCVIRRRISTAPARRRASPTCWSTVSSWSVIPSWCATLTQDKDCAPKLSDHLRPAWLASTPNRRRVSRAPTRSASTRPEQPTTASTSPVRERSESLRKSKPGTSATLRQCCDRPRFSWADRTTPTADRNSAGLAVGFEEPEPHLADSGERGNSMPKAVERDLSDDRDRRRV